MRFNKVLIVLLLLFSIISFGEKVEKKPVDSFKYFEVYDPFEPMNRRIYYFNYQFDKYIFLPTVKFYQTVTPKLVREGVNNFFVNSENISTVSNSILQFKLGKAMRALGRFTMNVTLGMGGIFDVASSMGMPKPHEDFGLTLARYGIGQGPYLVLPILGPSFLRDTVGKGVDTFGKNVVYNVSDLEELNRPEVTLLYGIDTRENIPFEYYQTGSPFEYEYIRFLYFKYRQLQNELGSEVF